jgi:hypothetical protein
MAARRVTHAYTGGESAITYPPMMMNVICIVKGITLQKPEPKLSAMDRGAAPIQSAPRATMATASTAKAKASGNQRSDQAQQRRAVRDKIDP